MTVRPIRRAARAALAPAVMLVIAASASVATAQAPQIHANASPDFVGEYIIDVETPPILDYTTADASPDSSGTTRIVSEDENGRLRGTSTTHSGVIDSASVLTGKVSTKKHLPFVQMKIVDVGTIDDDPTIAVGKLTASVFGWGADSYLVGEQLMKFCITMKDPIADRRRRICVPQRIAVEQHVPHIGTWQVRLALDRSGDFVSGPGWIVTAPLDPARIRFFEVEAVGKISTKTGLATVRLISRTDPSPGVVTLIGPIVGNFDDPQAFGAIHEVKGKLLGQSFDEVFDSNE
jgi:hypothetical protein